MKFFVRTLTMAALIGTSALLAGHSAYAIEGAIYGGPIGGTDIRSSYLPATPGFYVGLVALQSNENQYFEHNFTPLSGFPAGQFGGTLGAVGILYEYPTQIFGGKIASTFSGNYSAACLSVAGRSGCGHGLGDARADPIIFSRYIGLFGAVAKPGSRLPYGLTMSTGLNLTIPIGSYNPANVYNPGKGSFVISPNIGFSYLTNLLPIGDGTEITAKAFFNFGTYNGATQYANGNVVDIDYAVSQRIGHWQAGVAGNYATQVSNDYKSGVLVAQNGHRLVGQGTGPVIAYDFDSGVSVKAKVSILHDVQYGLAHGALGVLSINFKAF